MLYKVGDRVAVESWGGAYSPAIITKVMDGGASYSAESRDGLQTEREFVLPDKIRLMTAEEEEQYIEVEGETSSSKVSKKKKRKDKKKQKSKEKKRLKDEKKKAKSDARIAQKKAALKLKQEQKRKEKQANMNRILGIEEQVKEEEKQEEPFKFNFDNPPKFDFSEGFSFGDPLPKKVKAFYHTHKCFENFFVINF